MTQDENKTSFSTLIAIITLVLAVAALIFGDNLYQQVTGRSFFTTNKSETAQPITNTLSAPIVSAATPKNSTTTSLQFNTLTFSDNFENGNKNFVGGGGTYKVVDDGTGNNVLELSDAGSNSLVVYFGPQDISDCAIEYRVRIVSLNNNSETSGTVNLLLLNKNLGDAMYGFSLDPRNNNSLFYYFPPFENIGESQMNIETGKWYNIRVEMDGENLYLYISGVLVIKTKDSRVNSGNLAFQIYSNTTADFDDVKVLTP